MSHRDRRRRIRVLGLLAVLAAGMAAHAAPERSAVEGGGRAAAAGDERFESPGKPTAPIAIEHAWLEPPSVGRDLRLEITVGSDRALGDVTIRLTGDEGLIVDVASVTTRVAAIEAGARHAFAPAVLAATTGTHYLAVSVSAAIGGGVQTRSVTIPVRLGGAAAEKPGASAVDTRTGERVRSLPADERVGPRRR